MEWKVTNALSRDVEREQLNKILKDIKKQFSSIETVVNAPVRPAPTPVSPRLPVIVTLTGDVTGTATGTGQITIDTELQANLEGVEEAPDDGYVYWRGGQQWQPVPLALQSFSDITGGGFLSLDEDGWMETRVIEGEAGQIEVADGDGIEGNPVVSLADLPNSGAAPATLRRYTRDSKGRISGDQAATTTHLPEGSNLYFTDSRLYESLKSTLEAGANVTLTEDDLSETITISATSGGGGGTGTVDSVNSGTGIFVDNTDVSNPIVNLQPAVVTRIANSLVIDGTPTDGDIVEYNGTSGSWIPKKDPRELYLDGGNF